MNERKHGFEWLEEENEEVLDFSEESKKDIIKTADEIKELLIRKNKQYGNGNLTKHGHLGILVRLSDKLARLENLTKAGAKNAKEYDDIIKATEDAYKDIAGYAINALRLMRDESI